MGRSFFKLKTPINPENPINQTDETSSLTANDGCSVRNSSLHNSSGEGRSVNVPATLDQNRQGNSCALTMMNFLKDNKALLCTVGLIATVTIMFILIGYYGKPASCGLTNSNSTNTCAPNPGYRF